MLKYTPQLTFVGAESRTIVVGPESSLYKRTFVIRDVNWLVTNTIPDSGLKIKVKLRSTHQGAKAIVYKIHDNQARIELAEPERAITPGQACVMYDGTKVFGGGWITKEIN